MKTIRNKNYPEERALYGSRDIKLINCTFDGIEDGESALKESKNVTLEKCFFNLRYPLWHDENVVMTDCEMTDKCRAPLWYSNSVNVENCRLHGVKAFRECADINIRNSDVISPEFGWRSRGFDVKDSEISGEYPFFTAKGIRFSNVKLTGKYSFQYAEDVYIENSYFDTKDAFWHAKNVKVTDSVIKGEYLSWYSENLTLIRCRIIGTQPLCYCRGLKLIDCRTEAADLAFEYSDVEATVKGDILSVKNPRSGRIIADSIGEIILTQDSVYPCECEITQKKK